MVDYVWGIKMKKIVVLLLIALLVVGLFVSCNDENPKAKPTKEQTKEVVGTTIESLIPYIKFARDLFQPGNSPDSVKAEMQLNREGAYEMIYGIQPTVTTDASENSLSAYIVIEDSGLEETVELTDLEYSPSDDIVSGKLSLDYSLGDENLTISIIVKCDFAISLTMDVISTVNYSYVKYCGTEYDLASFDEEINSFLEKWPTLT